MKKYSEVNEKKRPSGSMINLVGNEIKKYKTFEELLVDKCCCYTNTDGVYKDRLIVMVYPFDSYPLYHEKFVKKFCVEPGDFEIFDYLCHVYSYEGDKKIDRKEFCPRNFWDKMFYFYKIKNNI